MEFNVNKRRKALTFPLKGKLQAQSLTTFVEGVHFDLLYATPREVAYKAAVTTLSELAAQGARPEHLHVQCYLKQDMNEHLIMELESGVQEIAKRFDLKFDFQVSGLSPTAILLQTLATGVFKSPIKTPAPKPNDLIAVTGPLGGAAAGLNCLRYLGRTALTDQEALVLAYLKPFARIDEARVLYEKKLAKHVVDLQDGLAAELNRVAAECNVGAFVEEIAVPISPHAVRGAQLLGITPERWSLYGSEDFELLFFCSPPQFAAAERTLNKMGCHAKVIGKVKPAAFGVKMKDTTGLSNTLPPRQWHPLVRRRRA